VIPSAPFAYAQARLQARHGRRPGSGDWERLERVGDFGHFIQSARGTGLEPWVRHLGTTSSAHEVERGLRATFRQDIEAVAAWQPPDWRPALLWTRALLELPALHHILQQRPPPEWMTRLPDTGTAAERSGEARRRALERSGLGHFAEKREHPLPETWLRQWHRLLPSGPEGHLAGLRRIEAALRRYRRDVARGEPGPDAALETDLTRLFRRHAGGPAAAYAHLGLLALDIQRLRAGLMHRRLFGGDEA
jgi:hypothetical protein